MRKLYTDVSLETAFMVSYNDVQTQACANDEDTVTIGTTEYVRLTDENGHNVSDGEGNQLLLNDGIIYKVVSGVPESTNVQVTDVVIPERYTLTINPAPNDATVTLTATGETQVGNSITADDGTTISYTVSASGYTTASGTYTLDGADHTENVVLEEEIELSLDVQSIFDDKAGLTLIMSKDLSNMSVDETATFTVEMFDADVGGGSPVAWNRWISGLPENTMSLTVTRIADETVNDIDGLNTDYTSKIGQITYDGAQVTQFANVPNNWTITPAKFMVVIDQEIGVGRLVVADNTNHYKELPQIY